MPSLFQSTISKLSLLALTLVVVAGCAANSNTSSQNTTSSEAKLQIVTSIPPLYSITANVVGDKAELYNLLPGDASEHQFSLKPSDIEYITKADAVIQTGLSAEEFLQDTITENISDTATLISVDDGIALLQSEHHDHDEEEHSDEEHEGEEHADEEHEGEELETDGHIWLSVRNAKIITQTIADELSAIDAENADYYQANASEYIAQLNELDVYATERLGSVSNKNFIPLHAAWIYLANDYNLNQVNAIEVIPGQEPSAKEIATLLEEIEEFAVPALFSEPQLENRITVSLASDTGLEVYTIDPLGTGPLSKELYIDTMRSNIDTLTNALK